MSIVNGTNNNEQLTGDANDNIINGLGGNDTLIGNEGNDLLQGGDGSDLIVGGLGDDTLVSSDSETPWVRGDFDTLQGGSGLDSYIVTNIFTPVSIEDSDGLGELHYLGHHVTGVAEASTFAYGILNWTITSENQVFHLTPRGYSDGTVNLSILAPDGGLFYDGGGVSISDWKQGDFGITLPGFGANIVAGPTDILIQGSELNDTLWGNDLDNILNGYEQRDIIRGRDGSDTIHGGAGHDQLYGEDGNDYLNGGIGRNFLNGGLGNDTLEAVGSNDLLIGGEGIDHFILGREADPNGDAIQLIAINDFDATSESFDISMHVDANSQLNTFDDLLSFAGSNPYHASFSIGATELIIYDVALNELSEANFVGLQDDPNEGALITGTDVIYGGWQKQFGLDGASSFQFVDSDGNGQLEFFGLYNGQLWQRDESGTWNRQWYAGDGIEQFQMVDIDGNGSTEFAGLYGGNLWIFEQGAGWTNTGYRGLHDFQYEEGSSNLGPFGFAKVYLEYDNGEVWEHAPGDGGWTARYEFENFNVNDFQILDIDGDGVTDYSYSGDGMVQSFEQGQGWTLYPQFGEADQHQFVDTDGDGRMEIMGNFGGEIWQLTLGDDGQDNLVGTALNDTIGGGSGDDTLTGGAGADRFEFENSSGIDIITDFEQGTDLLAFSRAITYIADDPSLTVQDILSNDALVYTSGGNTIVTFFNTTAVIQGQQLILTAADIELY